MDQEAFRKLLSTSKPGTSQSSSTAGKGSLLPPKAKDDQKKTTESSKAAFKPRKIKKQSGLNYRDRAAERRTGAAGDFAEVESVLENFEKQHADEEDREAVEEQRRYLGGDAEHTVLVKGLDFALLEQTKARLAASTSVQDDEELEEAFRGVVSTSPPPLSQPTTTTSNTKKRTREDIVRELRNKRTKSDSNDAESATPLADKALDEAKRDGKFKPIGFKPIGASKDKEGREVKKKKKRKVMENGRGDSQQPPGSTAPLSSTKDDPGASNAKQGPDKPSTSGRAAAREPEPQPVNEDFDIFADAGEYEGVNFDDDDDEDIDDSAKREAQPSEPPHDTIESTQPDDNAHRPRKKWFDDDDEPPSPPPSRPLPSLNNNQKGKSKEPSGSPGHTTPRDQRNRNEEEAGHDEEPEGISHLAPLTSSTIPSIRDILAADTALEAEEKRKARKEKRKRGGGGDGEGKKVSVEAKLNRDYQKLKSYTEKKDKSS